MALAALLRFIGLGTQSLWVDEIYSVELTNWPLDMILRVQDGHPPLFALLHVLVAHWIDADMAGRLIAAVAGVLAVGVLVQLVTEVWDVRTGVVAGVILAVSPLHVWYSQEGRSYAVVVLIATAASWALVRGMRGGGWQAWLAFGLLSLSGLFTHYLYSGLLFAQVVFLALVGGQGRMLAAIGAVAAIGVLCLPTLGPEATSFVGDQRGFEWLALPYAGFTYVAGFGLGPSIEALHRARGLDVVAGSWPAILVVGVAGLACTLALPRALRRAGRFGLYALLWAVVPILVVFAGSWLRNGAFNVRYGIAALPGIVLVLALVITDGSPRRLAVGLATLVALSIASIARDRLDDDHLREDVRSAAQFLAARVAPDERVVIAAHYMDFGVRHYYRDGGPALAPLPVRPIRTREDAVRDVAELRATKPATWLVLVRDWEDDPNGYLLPALEGAGVTLVARFPGVRIFRFAPPGS